MSLKFQIKKGATILRETNNNKTYRYYQKNHHHLCSNTPTSAIKCRKWSRMKRNLSVKSFSRGKIRVTHTKRRYHKIWDCLMNIILHRSLLTSQTVKKDKYKFSFHQVSILLGSNISLIPSLKSALKLFNNNKRIMTSKMIWASNKQLRNLR